MLRSALRASGTGLCSTHSKFCKHLPLPSPALLNAAVLKPLHLSNEPTWRWCSSASDGVSTSTGSTAPVKYDVRPLSKEDVEFSFARSGGAGGQNVNKLNTKVDMRFDLDKAGWIPDEVKDAIRAAEKNRFTKEGVLVVSSTKHRTQSANLDDALEKVQGMIDAAVEAVTPKEVDPQVVKRVQASIKAGKERRLDAKKKDSKKKQERRRKDWD